jgi:hypothetical protein
MKTLSLENHDAALSALVASQTAAALALQSRISNAERTVAAFTASPTAAGLAQAISAQGELDALAKLQDAMPDPSRREQALRDRYTVQNRDALLDILTADLSARLKGKSAWRQKRASEIAKLSELLALAEAPQAALANASNRAAALDAELAQGDLLEREARRNVASFAHDPTAENLNNARGALSTINF